MACLHKSVAVRIRRYLGRIRGISLVAASRITAALMFFGITLLAARLLTKPDYGRFVFFLGTATLVSTLFDFGVSVRVVTARDERLPGWREPGLTPYWSAQFLSYGLGGVACILVGFIPSVTMSFHVSPLIVAMAGMAGVSTGLAGFLLAVMQAESKWKTFASATVALGSLRLVTTLLGILAGSASSAVGGYLAGSWLGLAVLYWAWRELWRGTLGLSLRVSVTQAWQVWVASRWYAMSGFVGATAAYVPLAFVGSVGDAADLAEFGLAWSLGSGTTLLLTSAMTVLLPNGSDPSVPLARYRRDAIDVVLPILGLIMLGAILSPALIPVLFGTMFIASVVPLETLLAASIVLLIANPVQFLHYRLERARFLTLVDSVTLGMTAFGVIALPSSLGIAEKAALAILAAALVSRIVGIIGLLPHRQALEHAA